MATGRSYGANYRPAPPGLIAERSYGACLTSFCFYKQLAPTERCYSNWYVRGDLQNIEFLCKRIEIILCDFYFFNRLPNSLSGLWHKNKNRPIYFIRAIFIFYFLNAYLLLENTDSS